jgi:penicillin-binding protein 2
LVVLYSALENKVVDENYTYNCVGQVILNEKGETLKCNKLDGHGIQTLQETLSNSCNTAFYDIAQRLGQDKILDSAKTLHLDETVDIGIEETNLNLPESIPLNLLAIGQGSISLTPIQINQMTQIIANNGTYKPLYLYDSIINNNLEKVETFKTTKEEEIISPYRITMVKEMMKNVSKEGTAKDLSDLEGGCGVKTGTAQVTIDSVEATNGLITGYYPEENPKYAITVLVEATVNDGIANNKSAVPIFKEICKGLNKINKKS